MSADFLRITGDGADMILVGENQLKAEKNITLEERVFATGGDLYLHSNESVSVMKNISSNSLVEIHANIDCQHNNDEIFISEDSTVKASVVRIIGNIFKTPFLVDFKKGTKPQPRMFSRSCVKA